MNNLISTYRLQFRKEFSFKDLKNLIPYFQKLGIGSVYASPILESTPGSTHGYDGVNPRSIDPEIGSLEELHSLSTDLHRLKINWLQDIVPNHMAFHTDNIWLMDVLEKGALSLYASFFDIAWNSRLYHGRIMVPFLGFTLDEVLDSKELVLAYKDNRLVFQYADSTYPVSPKSYARILGRRTAVDADQSISQLLEQLSEVEAEENPKIYSHKWDEILLQLSSLARLSPVKDLLETSIGEINDDKSKLKQILDEQEYVLCHWQKTEEKINFRRFFTVNDLICLNIQHEDVFEQYHGLVKDLIHQEVFQGLRIDHVDGLFDPAAYLEKLREMAGDQTYISVEKILEKDEDTPLNWPVQGTTGYDFLAFVNNLMTNQASEEQFTTFYQQLTGNAASVEEQLIEKKTEILYEHMAGELENLYQLFVELNLVERERLDSIGGGNIKKAIGEFLIHCPVYRYYGNEFPLKEEEAVQIKSLLNTIRKINEPLSDAVGLLEEVLLKKPLELQVDYNKSAIEFYQRCMQFTGPLMAKGGEDTLMYNNYRFIAHNEVGDSVGSFGLKAKDFHKKMQERQAKWPLALNTTSTHDTKRGEDVRARLNVLTDLPEIWFSKVKEWQKIHEEWGKGRSGPDYNDAYFIYQTVAGARPMPGEDEDDFENRLLEYLEKALREGKTNSTWAEPNESYEADTKDFAKKVLDKTGPFNKGLTELADEIVDYGVVNSLNQLLLKFTCPGIPDVYQGTELWDFSLVDPDNRREVNYQKRQDWLTEMTSLGDHSKIAADLWETRSSGKIKLWLTHQLFDLRKAHEVLFSEGDYLPLKTKGSYKDHIFAFARKHKQTYVVIAVPLHAAILCKEQNTDILGLNWKDTRIELPEGVNSEWENLLFGDTEGHERVVSPADIFKKMPFAVLKGSKPENKRSAGVLLGINSLPSRFGIGDLGPESYAAADFLSRSNQKIWQMLPLNPVEAAQGNSPYSALSSMGGSPLLISLEFLAEDGLLDVEELLEQEIPVDKLIDYEKAGIVKTSFLKKAHEAFRERSVDESASDYFEFCNKTAHWLDDFALYMVLKNDHNGDAWTKWPEQFKLRNEAALKDLAEKEADEIDFIKWVQFVFDKQWKKIRTYCNARNIKLLGDIPFYVSYDSSDVWSNRDLFQLDSEGKITGIAGVPPDAFAADGQLWGMPVFNWEALKEQGYHWWIERLRRNVELYDFIRLDHFRAFADYWEVPAGEKTAVNGTWKLGPGADFFHTIHTALGDLPFVAEDLGEASDIVYQLRDQFNLPGMKVLHYAFDESMPQSDFIPHNYPENCLAYTGTHDNNTTLGWFHQDADAETRSRLEKYTGTKISDDNVCEVMARLIYGSVAKTVIMPMQDVLQLDESCRMNIPGSEEHNWGWRILPGQITKKAEKQLKDWTKLFNRE